MNLYLRLKTQDIRKRNVLVQKLVAWLKAQQLDLSKYRLYKSGVSKERISLNADWVYQRAAAMLIMGIHNPRSVKFYRRHFRSLKNRGVKPDRVYNASGFVIRHILQELVLMKFLSVHPTKGRYTSGNVISTINMLNEN